MRYESNTVSAVRPRLMAVVGALSAVLAAGTARGQEPPASSADGLWTTVERAAALALRDADAEPWIQPREFHAVSLDRQRLLASLESAPMELTAQAKNAPLIVTLPMPDGTFARFATEEAPIMEPGLARPRTTEPSTQGASQPISEGGTPSSRGKAGDDSLDAEAR